jgi:RNA polymerase sigma-70 factor (ECF subfamily)
MQDSEFEQLYEDQAQALFGFLAYRTGDRALAEDVLGEAFERALSSRRRYDPARGSAKTWIYAIALNCLRDRQRRASAEARALRLVAVAGVPVGAATGAGTGLGWVDDRATVEAALGVLSEEEREVIALRYGGELTVPEIAELLGERLTTVEGRAYRALRKLRAELDAQ